MYFSNFRNISYPYPLSTYSCLLKLMPSEIVSLDSCSLSPISSLPRDEYPLQMDDSHVCDPNPLLCAKMHSFQLPNQSIHLEISQGTDTQDRQLPPQSNSCYWSPISMNDTIFLLIFHHQNFRVDFSIPLNPQFPHFIGVSLLRIFHVSFFPIPVPPPCFRLILPPV